MNFAGTTDVQVLNGDGNGGPDMDTGWVDISVNFGAMAAGSHTFSLGAFLQEKNDIAEQSTVYFDDIHIYEHFGSSATGTINTLYGGDGLDTLYGSTETDIFVFEDPTAYNNIDVIENFNMQEEDKLDISDLVVLFNDSIHNISDYVQIVDSGANSLVQIDEDGTIGGANFTTIAQINGLNGLDELLLYNEGNLIA
jgi:hypothetical protein